MRLDRGLISIRKRHGRLIRAVAVFFLLYTGADILVPQYVCGGEEIGNLPLKSVVAGRAGTADKRERVRAVTTSSYDSQEPDQSQQDEDCFCCCSHVLPGLAVAHTCSSELKSPCPTVKADSPPTPPARYIDHPPRFA